MVKSSPRRARFRFEGTTKRVMIGMIEHDPVIIERGGGGYAGLAILIALVAIIAVGVFVWHPWTVTSSTTTTTQPAAPGAGGSSTTQQKSSTTVSPP
jgi:hypothetical protein